MVKGWEMMKLLNKMKKLINNIEIEIQKDIWVYKMSLYWTKCSGFLSNDDIDIKHEIDGKINLNFYCIDCGFKTFGLTGKHSS